MISVEFKKYFLGFNFDPKEIVDLKDKNLKFYTKR